MYYGGDKESSNQEEIQREIQQCFKLYLKVRECYIKRIYQLSEF